MRRFWGYLACTVLVLVLAGGSQAMDKRTLRWVRHKPRIDSIVVEGNVHFSDGQIKGRLYSKVHNFWRALKGDRRSHVQRETLARDTLEIKYLYFTEGFLGVRVAEAFEILEPDSSALVRVQIDEGRRFLYGERSFSGEFDRSFEFDLNKIARNLKPGEPVNPLELREVMFDMKTYLANRGFPYSAINERLDTTRADNIVPVTFNVVTDSLVTFGSVRIRGIDRFPEYTARRELKIKEGKTYRRADIIDSQRRLFESGYFSSVQLRQADNSADRYRPDFVLQVRERKPMFVTVTTGAGQSTTRDLEWDLSSRFGTRNLFGSRWVELGPDYGFSFGEDSRLITHRYRFRFTEPWFIGLRMPLFFTGEYEPPLRDVVHDFKVRRWATSVETNKRFGQKYRARLAMQLEWVTLTGIPADQVNLRRLENAITERRKIDFDFLRDSRDDIFLPRRGNVTDVKFEYFGGFLGGDDNFFKLRTSWSKFGQVPPGWISASRVSFSWAEPFDEAIYLGGANTVRSFHENRLGPLDSLGNPLGSKFAIIFNQEFRWRTIQFHRALPLIGGFFKNFPLWQSIFFDVGNGFSREEEVRLDNFAIAYGTGLQIVSPAGPIRIDYARRIKTEHFDFGERWHFTILYAF